MTPIFVHLEVNGKYYRKKLVALKKTAACEWRFLCINGETDGRIYSELGWKSEQEAIDAATNSETNPISFYDDVQTIFHASIESANCFAGIGLAKWLCLFDATADH